MLTQDPDLVRFVEELTEVDWGRAYASTERLGGFVFVTTSGTCGTGGTGGGWC